MEIDQAALQAYFTQLYPRRADLRIENVALLNSGWESDIIALDTCWQTAGNVQRDALVLRVYGVGEAEKARQEFNTLRLLAQAGYPVPRTDQIELEYTLAGRPFLIQERVNGQPLWPLLFQGSAEQRQPYIDLFCGLFARLHTLDWRFFTSTPEAYSAADLVEQAFAQWQPFIQAYQSSGFDQVWQWLLQRRATLRPMPPAVLHWDFHPHNILVDAHGSACVLDWTGFTISDPRFDLAWTMILMVPQEGEAWRATLLDNYQKHRGCEIYDLEYFEVAAALRRLFSVYLSLTAGPETLGMRSGAEEAMKRQIGAHVAVADILYQRSGLRISEFDDLAARLAQQ